MPTEQGPKYLRVRQADPSFFVRESFRTIGIDSAAGVKAVIGRRPGKGGTEIQTYMFDASKWTMESAKKWVESRKNCASATELFSRGSMRRVAVGSTAFAAALRNTAPFQDFLKKSAGMVSTARPKQA